MVLTREPSDNIFVECADTARADYVVTGNPPTPFWKKNKVITLRDFIDFVAPLFAPHCGHTRVFE